MKPSTLPTYRRSRFWSHPVLGQGQEGPFIVAEGYTHVGESGRRVKPLDLWNGFTPRLVEESNTFYPIAKWTEPDKTSYVGPLSSIDTITPYSGGLNPTIAWNDLDSRIRAKIKDSNLNLAQAFAEYRQTCKLYHSLATEIVGALRSLRRPGYLLRETIYRIKNPNSWPDKVIANRWLQYQYGWKPHMSDIYNYTDNLLKELAVGRNLFHQARDSNGKITGYKLPIDKTIGITARTTQYRLSRRVEARYRISEETLKSASNVGLTNPLLLAWEIIPYSFVIDWMFPIGNFLSSLDALAGIGDLSVHRGYKLELQTDFTFKTGDKAFSKLKRTERSSSSSLQLPRLGYEPSTSLLAVSNGLALLAQLR